MMLVSRRRILLIALAASVQCPHAEAVPIPRDLAEKRSLQIRVKLAAATDLLRIRGFDLRFIEENGGGARRLAARSDQAAEWQVSCKAGRVVAVNPKSRASLELKGPVTVETPAGFLQFQGRPYREALQIHADRSTCLVVNSVDVEKYLDGLVNSEFSSKWSEEAVASQVIAARTYAVYQINQARKRKDSRFDVEATVRDQVYDGVYKEDYLASRSVERTRGMILSASAGRAPMPLKAFYHSTCGGVTDLPERVWGGRFPGFKRTVRCPYCAVSPVYQWEVRLGQDELARAFTQSPQKSWPKDWKNWFSRGRLLGFQVVKTDDQGRALEVSSRWSLGSKIQDFKTSGAKLRSGVGVARLKSTWFAVRPMIVMGQPQYALNGRGNGHGVGLCQWGAKVMGEKGFKMASILKFYYPDAQLKKLW